LPFPFYTFENFDTDTKVKQFILGLKDLRNNMEHAPMVRREIRDLFNSNSRKNRIGKVSNMEHINELNDIISNVINQFNPEKVVFYGCSHGAIMMYMIYIMNAYYKNPNYYLLTCSSPIKLDLPLDDGAYDILKHANVYFKYDELLTNKYVKKFVIDVFSDIKNSKTTDNIYIIGEEPKVDLEGKVINRMTTCIGYQNLINMWVYLRSYRVNYPHFLEYGRYFREFVMVKGFNIETIKEQISINPKPIKEETARNALKAFSREDNARRFPQPNTSILPTQRHQDAEPAEPAEPAEHAEHAEPDDVQIQRAGSSSRAGLHRHYTVVRASAGKPGGRYASKSGPAAAARKAAAKRFGGKSNVRVTVRELGTDREFSYDATRAQLPMPVVRKIAGVMVASKYRVKVKAV